MANSWEGMLDAWDGRLKRAFLDSIYRIRDEAQIAQIVRMLEKGDVEGSLRAVGIDPVKFRDLDRAIEQAFNSGGDATAQLVPTRADDEGFRTKFEFDRRNRSAEDWLRQHSGTLIREIVDDQRNMVRDHLRAGLEQGQGPRETALDLVGRIGASGHREGGTVGLTSSQAGWVRNYEQELQDDLPAIFDRKLRDKRFDRAVRKAIESGEPIPAPLRADMVRNYKNRALRMRAEGIARTEAMRALHQAQDEAMQQAVGSGAVDEAAVQFVWRTARDNRVRDSHRSMNGQVRAIGVAFETGNGNRLLFPGDPSGPPSETIQCRCAREVRIDFLRGLR